MSELQSSYSSANVFPAKILHHQKLMRSCLHEHKVFPIHLQLNPTNRCNFNCDFCSCSGRDKRLELSIDELGEIMANVETLGCESVTVTGSGEPLMHKDLDGLLDICTNALGIQVGLVTNGLLLDRLNNGNIVWCRISSSDNLLAQLERIGKTVEEWFEIIDNACHAHPQIDWAFSHVRTIVGGNTDHLENLIEFANEHDFTHVRVVSDIFKMPDLGLLQSHLNGRIDLSKVIFQPRSRFTYGSNPCYISLLKPVVGADGYVYPCCGTQYALANPSHDYEKVMRMGKATDLDKLVEDQAFFDGRMCVKCYYDSYNYALRTMLGNVKHAKFI